MQLSNPRTEARVEDWPLGGNKRGPAVFTTEINKRGTRIIRTTFGKPKTTNYYRRALLVDGDDGRIYILAFTEYAQVILIPGTLQGGKYVHENDTLYELYKSILFPPGE